MANDNQLLDITRDYFQFTTKFFEVINVSATHIYHSALELSPLSSTVRKFYYPQQPCPSPRVITGVPDSWDDSTVSTSTKHSHYNSSIWSPCGHFVAGVTEEAVEIRGALALNLLFTLQSAGVATKFLDGLAYSPDGHSLACCSDTAIIIWDTQTGGVVGKVNYEANGRGSELVWSLDGHMISIISPLDATGLRVCVYDVMSGTMQSSCRTESRDRALLWAYSKSFRLMTTANYYEGSMVNIYEVGSTLTMVEQFHFQPHRRLGVFSPAAYRISISTSKGYNQLELLILDVHNSEILLQDSCSHSVVTFSPDGNFVAALVEGQILIWKYTSGHYIRWRGLQLASLAELQFSPTSSSILSHGGPLLYVFQLDHSPAVPTIEFGATIHSVPWDAFSPEGVFIVLAHCGESVITITNLRPQNPSPSQFIDTGLKILGIVLTGNVLLVRGSDTVVAWLLTEEGMVDGTFGKMRVDHSNSLWDVPFHTKPNLLGQQQEGGSDNNDDLDLWFSVKGEIVAIKQDQDTIHLYHTKTGEILSLDGAHEGDGYIFSQRGCNLYHVSLCQQNKCSWPISQTTLKEGWVKDPGGKHRLWLHPHWRVLYIYYATWLDQVTTLRLQVSESELVIVRF